MPRVQEQATLGTPEAGEFIDQQKTLYCRTMFWHNQTLIQNETRQLLRYGKSQCPSHTKEYLHKSEKSSQQNFCGQTSEGEQSVQMLHKGGESFLKKRKKLHFYPNDA